MWSQSSLKPVAAAVSLFGSQFILGEFIVRSQVTDGSVNYYLSLMHVHNAETEHFPDQFRKHTKLLTQFGQITIIILS